MNHLRRYYKPTIAILLALGTLIIFLLYRWWTRAPEPYNAVVTLAVPGQTRKPVTNHYQPFGIAADDDGNIYITESIAGRIYRIPHQSYLSNAASPEDTVIADRLETPSAIAIDDDGNLIVANTGAHTIVRIDLKNLNVDVIAGSAGQSGFADGPREQARFNGPVGIAISDDGTIFVADTYNDRIRAISRNGDVRTIAGAGEPGFADSVGTGARFDTPCGIAVDYDGSLLIADTGNHRIRRIEMNGRVTTIAGTGEVMERDGSPSDAAFDEPIAVAVRDKYSFYVADSAGSSIRLCTFGEKAGVTTIAGGYKYGFVDGELTVAVLDRPAGLVLLPRGELAFCDSENGVVRAFVPKDSAIGRRADPKSLIIQAPEMRALLEPRWPFDPPEQRRDIAGTFGEVRGERLPEQDAWFHNGLDVPGAYGEQARAVYSETVTRTMAVSSVDTIRERLRLPLFEYIHLRIARDQNDQPIGNFPEGAVKFRRDPLGKVTGVRIRRGTHINAGDIIGTLNRLNHVHLKIGPEEHEFNPLTIMRFPGLTDTKAPVIESVRILNDRNETIDVNSLRGRLQIAVRAYDQVDGNPGHRRLGVYRLGYQVFKPDGSATGQVNYGIVFDRLPPDYHDVMLAYAEGSRSGFEGGTVFEYLVTNIVRGGEARQEYWDTANLAPGDYILRVVAEDFSGNQGKHDLNVTIVK